MAGLSSALSPLAQTSAGGGSRTTDTLTTQTLRFEDKLSALKALSTTIGDGIGVAPSLLTYRGIVMLEHLRLASSQVANSISQVGLADTARLTPKLYPAVPMLLTDGIGVALTELAQLAVKVTEQLGLTPVIAPTMLYGQVTSDTIRVASALAKFLGGDIIDTVDLLEITSQVTGIGGVLNETIGVAATLSPQLILRVIAEDTIGIDDIDVLSMIYSPIVVDGVSVSAGYLAPDGSFTTWAMNTRSSAVTEYSNYAFNSFAQLGHAYIGASSSGLYELTGDDDAGTDIIAEIKSGFAQWASTKLTGFKGIYLGTRGGGNFVLKLETGDGKTYIYPVSARDMATTKVTLGKGLRARYFRFELTSTGQDFDLDTIEFVPLVSERRV